MRTRSVGVATSVSHGEDTDVVEELEVLVIEAVSVNALTTSSVTVGEVSSLDHEVRDDTMEAGTLITEARGTGAELLKVVDRLGDSLTVKAHHNATSGLSSDLYST